MWRYLRGRRRTSLVKWFKYQIPTDFVKIDKRNAQKEDVAGVDLYFQGTYYAVRLLE